METFKKMESLLIGQAIDEIHSGGGGSVVLMDFPGSSLMVYSSWRLKSLVNNSILTTCQDDTSIGGIIQTELAKVVGQKVIGINFSRFHDVSINFENDIIFESFSDINMDNYSEGENWCFSVVEENLTYCSIGCEIKRFISDG